MTVAVAPSNTGTTQQRRLHVRLVTWDDDPPVGGQGVYVRELRKELIERGLRVSTVAGRGPFAMRYRRFTNRPHIDMSIALNRSAGALLTGEPDLLHLSGGPGGLQLLRRVEVPVVFTAHHTFHQSHSGISLRRAYGLVEARSYLRSAAIAAVSRTTADHVVEMGIPPERVVVISPGVRVAEHGIDDTEREPGRILFVGRLEPEKGPFDAVTAMDAVATRLSGVRGYLVGTGSLSARLRRAVSRTEGRVHFLGHLTDDEVAREYRRAEVVLMPSAFEGLGMVALEAMAAGAAVVGYDVTGLRETLAGAGCFVPRGDVEALASTTTRLLAQRGLRSEVVQRSFEDVRARRSWQRCAQQFEQLYTQVVSRGEGGDLNV